MTFLIISIRINNNLFFSIQIKFNKLLKIITNNLIVPVVFVINKIKKFV